MPAIARRVVKAGDEAPGGAVVAYNFEDLHAKCEEHLAGVRAQTRQLIETATSEADEIGRKAHEEGLAAGHAEGLAKAQAEVESRIQAEAKRLVDERFRTLEPALNAAVTSLVRDRDLWLDRWENEAVELSLSVAAHLTRRQFECDRTVLQEVVREALGLAASDGAVVLLMHPDDVAALPEGANPFVESLGHAGDVTVREDPSVGRGGCVVKTERGRIDASLHTRLRRLAEEWLPDGATTPETDETTSALASEPP